MNYKHYNLYYRINEKFETNSVADRLCRNKHFILSKYVTTRNKRYTLKLLENRTTKRIKELPKKQKDTSCYRVDISLRDYKI